MLNEWMVLDGGLGVTHGFMDAAGSITIHAFGAYFGVGLSMVLWGETTHHLFALSRTLRIRQAFGLSFSTDYSISPLPTIENYY